MIIKKINKGPYLLQTILNDKNETKNEAINERKYRVKKRRN